MKPETPLARHSAFKGKKNIISIVFLYAIEDKETSCIELERVPEIEKNIQSKAVRLSNSKSTTLCAEKVFKIWHPNLCNNYKN